LAKKRLDQILAEQGLVSSRTLAQSLIIQGQVLVNGEKVTKPGHRFSEDSISIEIKKTFPYVSRGALKLKKALEVFSIDPRGRVAMDIGSSTGGFTDVLLKNGAAHVYAVDVGTNQLAYSLRSDSRVTVMEQTNARYLKRQMFAPLPDLAVTDVSFISLSLILPVIAHLGCRETVALIKPQFEVGKEIPGFDGVVRKDKDREKAVEKVKQYAMENGFLVKGVEKSPIQGPKGNVEYLIYLSLPQQVINPELK
jgi:23S rRNA (cytidine1920-2'-O)/16S rRNA (cytidine1409-2'-O)-methyltransferase